MGKTKSKVKPISYDIEIGIDEIIPSTQEAYKDGKFSERVRKEESEAVTRFINKYKPYLDSVVKKLTHDKFPTKEEVFVLVIQFFNVQSQYNSRDVDNMAKTLLDVLKGKIYYKDSQVKTLVAVKLIEQRVPDNFAFVGVKALDDWSETTFLKSVGVEAARNYYFELIKSRK